MNSQDCLFCHFPEDRVIYRLSDYLLCAGLCPIVPGHILIIPNGHVKSFTNLTPDQHITFSRIRKNIKSMFINHFGACLMFEHGNHKNRIGLHSHAHMHIIPTVIKDDIRHLIQSYNPTEYIGDYGSNTSEQ